LTFATTTGRIVLPGGQGASRRALRERLIMFKRIVASVFVAVIGVVGATAPASAQTTSAASYAIDWE
jgi:hypothetical protein